MVQLQSATILPSSWSPRSRAVVVAPIAMATPPWSSDTASLPGSFLQFFSSQWPVSPHTLYVVSLRAPVLFATGTVVPRASCRVCLGEAGALAVTTGAYSLGTSLMFIATFVDRAVE